MPDVASEAISSSSLLNRFLPSIRSNFSSWKWSGSSSHFLSWTTLFGLSLPAVDAEFGAALEVHTCKKNI